MQTATARVLKLFAEFKSEYGDLFEYKKHRFEPARAREWAVELLESGINAEQYQHGRYQAVKNQKYPVERAYDFIQLCKQGQASEYPAAQSAFNTACQNCGMKGDVKRDWKHEVVYETANRIGWGVLASATEYYFKTFQEIYEQVVSEHKNGDRFVIPEERQLAYEHTPVQQGTAASANIDAFLAKFGSKKGEAV
ncbi:hypothetical protein [Psychrobacter glacincola]|uniref:hypothetical protein n=1 Tax=Psychrobacter glacincola TaxID=56810 RepID=UPI0039AEBC61